MNKKPVVDVIIKLRNLRLALDFAIVSDQPITIIKDLHFSIKEKELIIKEWEKSLTAVFN